jgi:hypothetical protein
MKRILDLDPLTGEATYFIDNHDGTFTISNQQSGIENILEANKREANSENIWKKGIKKGWAHYATIPNVLVAKWSHEVGGDILSKKFEKELFKRINNPDYKYLKTTEDYAWKARSKGLMR